MPSLSDAAIQTTYVASCQQLRNDWAGFGAGHNANNTRRLKLLQAVNRALQSCAIPTVTINSPLNGGCYLHSDRWEIEFGAGYLTRDISVDLFSRGVSTLYHEARHAEQWYRMAQGFAAGKFLLPHQGLGPRPPVTPQNISQQCNIAIGTAQHAYQSRNNYPQQMDGLISKWYRSVWGYQRQHRGQVLQHLRWDAYFNPAPDPDFAQYLNLPEEKDAFEIQDEVLARLSNALNMWA